MLNLNPLFKNYFIRINEYPGYAKIIDDLLSHERYPLALAIKHEGSKKENPHFHLIVSTVQTLRTLRTFLKTRFKEGKGNGHMSIKEWDGNERAIQYLYHESACEVLCSKGFTPEFLEEQRTKALKFTEEKKKYTDSLFEYVMWDILNNQDPKTLIGEHEYNGRLLWSHECIAHCIWDMCKEHKKSYPNKFLLERMIQKVQAELSQKGLKNCPTWAEQKRDWYGKMFMNNEY